MAASAVKLLRASKYRNAGTVEFLLHDGSFYFLEVNSRLQVEHPITEMRFDCDLVAEQLRIAAGSPLRQVAAPRGHAIECRIYAEDPAHDFRPTAGRVLYLALPSGPGVRFDTFLAPGLEIGSYYDGLLGKLICYGADREQARQRMIVALDEFSLGGVGHTGAFLRDVVASKPFARGDLSTSFISERFPHWRQHEDDVHAALIAALLASQANRVALPGQNGARSGATSPWEQLGEFRLGRER